MHLRHLNRFGKAIDLEEKQVFEAREYFGQTDQDLAKKGRSANQAQQSAPGCLFRFAKELRARTSRPKCRILPAYK